jgi:hypothetical protein
MSNPSSLVLSESELALLAMDSGRWAAAAEHVQRALEAIDEHRMHDYATSLLAFAAAARLAVHRGDATEAERQLAHAMRARPSCTYVLPFVAMRLRLQLAKVYRASGDAPTARHLLKEIDDILSHRPDLGALVDEVDEPPPAATPCTGRWPSACSAGSRLHGPDWYSSAVSMSYPSAIANFGAAATTLGNPTTGTTPTSTSTISAAVAPAPTAASACAP